MQSGNSTARPQSTARSNPNISARISTARSSARGIARGSGAVSNYQQVKNALTFVCLAGGHAEEDRKTVLGILDELNSKTQTSAMIRSEEGELNQGGKEEEAVSSVSINQFLILLHKSKTISFRGVYGVDSYTGEVLKLFGRGPRVLDMSLTEEFLKYESSTRSFKSIMTKTFTSTTDAVSIDMANLKK